MANVNLNNCSADPKNYPIPPGQDTVTFHAVDATYTLYFRKTATFGTPAATIPQGSQTPLTVYDRVATGYCVAGPGCPGTPPCPPSGDADDDGDPYEITIGSEPGPDSKGKGRGNGKTKSKSKSKPKAKAAAKRAPAKVKAKAKAKVKAKAKPKAKPKAKAKPKKKR